MRSRPRGRCTSERDEDLRDREVELERRLPEDSRVTITPARWSRGSAERREQHRIGGAADLHRRPVGCDARHRPTIVRAKCAELRCPELLECGWIAREREHALTRPSSIRNRSTWSMSSARPFRLPNGGRALRRDRRRPARRSDGSRTCHRLLRQPCEEAEDLVATVNVPAMIPSPGRPTSRPRRTARERKALLSREGVEDPSDSSAFSADFGLATARFTAR